MKCEIHVEITISQTHSNSKTRHKSITVPFGMTSNLQGKYGHCNTYRFVRQFKRFLSYSRMVAPNGVPARPGLVLILKKNPGSCPSGGVRGTHISQPQPVEPPCFESKYLAARILALGKSPHVPGP